jgi:hypothetical protein
MKHVRTRILVGGNQLYAARKVGSHATLCGAPVTIHDVPFSAFRTMVGVERIGPGLCAECVRLRLEASSRSQVNRTKRRAIKRAEREATNA